MANTSECSSSHSSFATAHDISCDRRNAKELDDNFIPLEGNIDIPKRSSNSDAKMDESNDGRCSTEFVFQPPEQNRLPAKRLRVSDINVSRYDEEFVEIEQIASGVFGKVMAARHRLDGMVYAIKVSC